MRTFSDALAQALKTDPESSPAELYLDGRFAFQKDDSFQELSQLTDLERLSLGSCALRGPCLASFPPLQRLTFLSLTDNAVGGDLHHLTVLSGLKDLDLSGNRIADLGALAPLTALHHLTALDISGCPAELKDPTAARKTVFDMLAVLPALKYVNGEDLLGNEKPVDDDDASEEEEEDDDEDYEGEEEDDDGEAGEAGEGAEEGGAGAGGEAGDDGDDDDDEGAGGDEGDDDAGDEEGEEEEEVPTAALVQQELMSDDEDEFLVGEEEEEDDDDFDSEDDDAAPARKRAKKAAESEDEEEEEEEDEEEESDYDGDE